MVIYAGQQVTADDLDALEGLTAFKTADQSYTSTTLANDNELIVPVAASTTYLVTVYLDYEGGTAGSSDMKVGWTVPTGATLRWTNIGKNASGGSTGNTTNNESSSVTSQTNGAGALSALTIVGSLVVGGTAGNLQLQAAQNTASGTAVIIHAQSYMTLQQIS